MVREGVVERCHEGGVVKRCGEGGCGGEVS